MGKLARDSVNTSIIIFIGFVFGTLSSMFIYPKLFSKDELGIFRYITGWATIFAQFCSFGVGSAAIRTYYKLKDDRKHAELNGLLLLVPMIILLAFTLVFTLTSDFFIKKTLNGLPYATWAVVVSLVVVTIAMTYVKTYQYVATILQRTPAAFFMNEIVIKVMVLTVFLLLYFSVVNSNVFLLLLALVYVMQLLALLLIIRPYFKMYPLSIPSVSGSMPFMKLSLFCLVDNSASILVAQIDMMMVGALCANSLASMQEYSMAISVATVVFLPWRSFTSTSVPFIAEAFARNDLAAIDNIYRKTSLSLTIFGLAVFTLIFVSIDNIIAVIPDNYTVIKYPVLFIGIGKVVDMMFSVNGNIIALSPYFRLNLYYSLGMVALLFAANWVLIPITGITGSAIATAISLLVFNVLRGLLIYRKYNIHPFHPKTAEVLLVMSIVFAGGMFFPDLFEAAFLSLCARSAVVALAIYAYLAIMKPSEDIEKLRLKMVRMVWKKA